MSSTRKSELFLCAGSCRWGREARSVLQVRAGRGLGLSVLALASRNQVKVVGKLSFVIRRVWGISLVSLVPLVPRLGWSRVLSLSLFLVGVSREA